MVENFGGTDRRPLAQKGDWEKRLSKVSKVAIPALIFNHGYTAHVRRLAVCSLLRSALGGLPIRDTADCNPRYVNCHTLPTFGVPRYDSARCVLCYINGIPPGDSHDRNGSRR